MKRTIIIAGLLGIASGLILRKAHAPPASASEDHSTPASATLSQATTASLANSPNALSWDLRGNLTSDELFALPHGGHLLAEMHLWSMQATPAELAAHWDRLIASGDLNTETLDQLITLWVRQDPDSAREHFRGTDQEQRFVWSLARIDPQLALDTVDPKQTRLFSMVLRSIGQNDPYRAMELLEKSPEYRSYQVTQGIIDGLADVDLAAAVDYSSQQNQLDQNKLKSWLAREPHSAFAWSLAHPALTGQAVTKCLPQLMEQDPEHFASEIARLPTGKFKLDLLKAQAKYLASQDPDQAFALADSLEQAARLALLDGMGESFEKDRPELALHLIETLFAENKDRENLSRTIDNDWVSNLIESDPITLLKIAREASPLPEGQSLLQSTEASVLNRWTQLDPSASAAWIQTHEPGSYRDDLIAIHLNPAVGDQILGFDKLAHLSAQISDDSRRLDSTETIFSTWQNYEPEELKRFIESSQASPEQREFYQSKIDHWKFVR